MNRHARSRLRVGADVDLVLPGDVRPRWGQDRSTRPTSWRPTATSCRWIPPGTVEALSA